MDPREGFRGSTLEQLRRGEYGLVSAGLRAPLQHLIAHGYHVQDIHLHHQDVQAFEIVLDQPIPADLVASISVPDSVQRFDDLDHDDRKVGIGFVCSVTNQSLTGLW